MSQPPSLPPQPGSLNISRRITSCHASRVSENHNEHSLSSAWLLWMQQRAKDKVLRSPCLTFDCTCSSVLPSEPSFHACILTGKTSQVAGGARWGEVTPDMTTTTFCVSTKMSGVIWRSWIFSCGLHGEASMQRSAPKSSTEKSTSIPHEDDGCDKKTLQAMGPENRLSSAATSTAAHIRHIYSDGSPVRSRASR